MIDTERSRTFTLGFEGVHQLLLYFDPSNVNVSQEFQGKNLASLWSVKLKCKKIETKIQDTYRDKAFSLGFEGVHELSLLIPSSRGIVETS